MKAEYIVPSIIVMDYEMYLDTLTLSGTDGDENDTGFSKDRGDNLIPSISMDNDDDW